MLYCYNVIMCNLFVFSLPIFGMLRTMELAFKRNPRQQALLHGLHKSHVFRLITTKTIMEGSFPCCHNPGGGSKVSLADFLIGIAGATRPDSRYPVVSSFGCFYHIWSEFLDW